MFPSQPCPVCAAPVHPIAGRCKHCRTDLVARRIAERRAAGVGRWPAALGPAPLSAATLAAPLGAPTIPDLAAVGRGVAADARSARAWLARRWPFVVSALALIAILVSISLLAATPAGEAPPRGTPAARHAASGAAPVTPMPDPRMDPSLPAPSPPPPSPGPNPALPPAASGPGAADSPAAFATALTTALCEKLTACGAPAELGLACQGIAAELADADPADLDPSCAFDRVAAASCLGAIDRLACDGAPSADLGGWMRAAQDVAACAGAYVCP
jgi:hypothetical protein